LTDHTLRAIKLQFPGHFWPAGYGLHTPSVANKLAMFFFKQHDQLAHQRTFSRYSETHCSCC